MRLGDQAMARWERANRLWWTGTESNLYWAEDN